MKKITFIIMLMLSMSSALALTLQSPQNTTYISNPINIKGETNSSANISYALDGVDHNICNSCTTFNLNVNLDSGSHNLSVTSNDNASSYAENRIFNVEILTLAISSPKSISYQSNTVPVNVTSSVLANLSYRIDGFEYQVLCNDCINATKDLNLSSGLHTIRLRGKTQAQSKEIQTQFNINIPSSLSIFATKPSGSYRSLVPLDFQSNKLATLSYQLDGNELVTGCTNCTRYQQTLSGLSNGSHSIVFTAFTANEAKNISRSFAVIPEIKSNRSNFSFAKGFNDLPKQFESGEVTNEELQQILQNNLLPPGILNRLIKTGKLDSNSITEMLRSQQLPPGIFRKAFRFMHWGNNDLIEQLAKRYDLTDDQISLIISRQDVPPRTFRKLIKNEELSDDNIDRIISEKGNSRAFGPVLRDIIKSEKVTDEQIQQIENIRPFIKGKITDNLSDDEKEKLNSLVEKRSDVKNRLKEIQNELKDIKKNSHSNKGKGKSLGRQED